MVAVIACYYGKKVDAKASAFFYLRVSFFDSGDGFGDITDNAGPITAAVDDLPLLPGP